MAEDPFKRIIEDLDEIAAMIEKVDLYLIDPSLESKDAIAQASAAAGIDLDSEALPVDKLFATIEEAAEEDKTVTKFEQALEKKITEMLENE